MRFTITAKSGLTGQSKACVPSAQVTVTAEGNEEDMESQEFDEIVKLIKDKSQKETEALYSALKKYAYEETLRLSK